MAGQERKRQMGSQLPAQAHIPCRLRRSARRNARASSAASSAAVGTRSEPRGALRGCDGSRVSCCQVGIALPRAKAGGGRRIIQDII